MMPAALSFTAAWMGATIEGPADLADETGLSGKVQKVLESLRYVQMIRRAPKNVTVIVEKVFLTLNSSDVLYLCLVAGDPHTLGYIPGHLFGITRIAVICNQYPFHVIISFADF